MTSTAIITLVLGVLIILSRGPLLFTPARTTAVYRRLFATNARIRVAGVFAALLGLALILAAQGESAVAAHAMLWVGWFLLGGTLLLHIPFPGIVALFADGLFDALADDTTGRVLGAIGVAIGLIFVYVGLVLL